MDGEERAEKGSNEAYIASQTPAQQRQFRREIVRRTSCADGELLYRRSLQKALLQSRQRMAEDGQTAREMKEGLTLTRWTRLATGLWWRRSWWPAPCKVAQ